MQFNPELTIGFKNAKFNLYGHRGHVFVDGAAEAQDPRISSPIQLHRAIAAAVDRTQLAKGICLTAVDSTTDRVPDEVVFFSRPAAVGRPFNRSTTVPSVVSI